MTEEMKNVTPETAEAPEHVETMEDYKEELEASFKQIHEGDILTQGMKFFVFCIIHFFILLRIFRIV